jgi:hypothetical protein
MDEWHKFERAKKAVAAFETQYAPLRDVLVTLGRILKDSGWGEVRFAGATEEDEITFAASQPLDRKALEIIPDLIRIVDEYGGLVRNREEAFRALPQSLQDELNVRNRPRAR